MNLYLIRHADAGSRDEWEGDDSDRPLSQLGHIQARTLAESLKQRGILLEAILTSPLIRTAQTAAEIRDVELPHGPEPEHCELLAPDELRPRKLSKLLAGLELESVAIVGHEPDLSIYLAWLLGTDPDRVHLEKGGAVLVQFADGPEKGGGTLSWMITPEWFMAEAKETVGV